MTADAALVLGSSVADQGSADQGMILGPAAVGAIFGGLRLGMDTATAGMKVMVVKIGMTMSKVIAAAAGIMSSVIAAAAGTMGSEIATMAV